MNPNPEPGADTGRKEARIVLVLLILAFVLAWLPRLFWGFWTDEAGTFWMAAEGWRAAVERTSEWAGQSLLYSVVESFFTIKGRGQEFLLRIPSVLAMVWAGWQLRRIALLAIGKHAGWLALIPLACAPDAMEFGTSARPYALAMAASLASFRYLLEWQQLENGAFRRVVIVKYLCSAILTIYLHYLFAFVLGLHFLYFAFCRVRNRGFRLDLPVAAAVVIPLSLVPLISPLLVTARTTSDFANASKPGFGELLQMCFPPALLLGSGLGIFWLFVTVRKLRWVPPSVSPELAFLVLLWILFPPLIFFAVANVTPHSIFSSRYLLFTMPAFLLLVTWVVSGLEKPAWRMTMTFAIFGATVLHPGMLFYSFHEGPKSWRPPLTKIAQATASADDPAPVFVESGMANSGGLNWQEHDPSTSPLYAALLAYPLRNPTIPLPYQFSKTAQEFIQQKLQGALGSRQRIWLIAGSNSPQAAWMVDYLKRLGYQAHSENFSEYVVVDFRKDAINSRASVSAPLPDHR